MTGFIAVCSRDLNDDTFTTRDVERCAALVAPDNIEPNPTSLYQEPGLLVGVLNPLSVVPRHEGSVCLGSFFGPAGAWWQPLSAPPDGSYAILRHDPRSLELVTDQVGSRAVWYVLTERTFLASTSQRALVALLGSLDFNHEAVSWMLVGGHLGPSGTWDRRLHRVPTACRLTLDRAAWTVTEHRQEIPISPAPGSKAEHIDRLRSAILDTCAALDLPSPDWSLLLSGGMDSRALLFGLVHAGRRPHCLTWGLESALSEPENDAFIARQLATTMGVEHTYLRTETSSESVADVLDRFLRVGEGAVEDLSGYTDGMAIWKRLFESGVSGIIRGDEPSYGYHFDYHSEHQIRARGVGRRVSDYAPTHPIRHLDLTPQLWPEPLHRRPDEPLHAYNGRLYEQLAFPAKLAPLSSLKAAFVEIANPLLSRRVIEAAHQLPEAMRRGRNSIEAAVTSLGPSMPFAKESAPASLGQLVDGPELRSEMLRGFASPAVERVFAERDVTLLRSCVDKPPASHAGPRLRAGAKAVLPKRWVERVKPAFSPPLSERRLAFRAYIAVRMAEILAGDAQALGRTRNDIG